VTSASEPAVAWHGRSLSPSSLLVTLQAAWHGAVCLGFCVSWPIAFDAS